MGCAVAANSGACSGSTLCAYTAHHNRWAEVPLTRWAMRITSHSNIASLCSVQIGAPQSGMNDLCQRNETRSVQSGTGLLMQASRRGESMWHSAHGLNNSWWPDCARWHHQLRDAEGECFGDGRARDRKLGVSGEHAAPCPANRSILAVCKAKDIHLVDGTCVGDANAGPQCTKHRVVRGFAPTWWTPGYIDSASHNGPWVTSWSPDGNHCCLECASDPSTSSALCGPSRMRLILAVARCQLSPSRSLPGVTRLQCSRGLRSGGWTRWKVAASG